MAEQIHFNTQFIDDEDNFFHFELNDTSQDLEILQKLQNVILPTYFHYMSIKISNEKL